MTPYILIAVVLGVLYVWWRLMEFTFDLIERAHDRLRESESRDAGTKPVGDRGDCDF